MLYIQHWKIKSGYHQKSAEKFLATGAPYPGVKSFSRYHSPGSLEGWIILDSDDRLEEPLWSDTAGKWNDQNNISEIPGGLGHHGIAEISLARSNPNIAKTWNTYKPTLPENSLNYLDSAYAIVDGHSWEEAKANAVNLGGNLVTLNTAAEQTWLEY